MNQSRFPRLYNAGLTLVLSCGLFGCATTGEGELTGPPPAPPTPEQEVKSLIDRVQGSGDTPAQAKPVLQRAADFAFDATFGPPSPDAQHPGAAICYASGCLQTVVYRDACAEDAAKARLKYNAQAPLRNWPGVIYATPALRLPDGRLQVTWALLVPDLLNKQERLEALLKPAPKQPVFSRPVCGGRGDNTATENTTMPVLK